MTEIFKFCDNTIHNLASGQVLERRHENKQFLYRINIKFTCKNLGVSP